MFVIAWVIWRLFSVNICRHSPTLLVCTSAVNSIDAKPDEKYVEGRTLAEAFNDGRTGMKKLFECRDKYPELKQKGIANLLTLDLVRYGCVSSPLRDGPFLKAAQNAGWTMLISNYSGDTTRKFERFLFLESLDSCRDVVAHGGIVRETLNVYVHSSAGIQIFLPFSQLPLVNPFV